VKGSRPTRSPHRDAAVNPPPIRETATRSSFDVHRPLPGDYLSSASFSDVRVRRCASVVCGALFCIQSGSLSCVAILGSFPFFCACTHFADRAQVQRAIDQLATHGHVEPTTSDEPVALAESLDAQVLEEHAEDSDDDDSTAK
jgi:hypothetical protein